VLTGFIALLLSSVIFCCPLVMKSETAGKGRQVRQEILLVAAGGASNQFKPLWVLGVLSGREDRPSHLAKRSCTMPWKSFGAGRGSSATLYKRSLAYRVRGRGRLSSTLSSAAVVPAFPVSSGVSARVMLSDMGDHRQTEPCPPLPSTAAKSFRAQGTGHAVTGRWSGTACNFSGVQILT
jgi:hypothetical protein